MSKKDNIYFPTISTMVDGHRNKKITIEDAIEKIKEDEEQLLCSDYSKKLSELENTKIELLNFMRKKTGYSKDLCKTSLEVSNYDLKLAIDIATKSHSKF